MTEAEQLCAAWKAIKAGVLPGESYERYAWRLVRMVRVYKIWESSSHSALLELMKVTTPSSVLATMNLWYSMATVMNLVTAPTPSLDDTGKKDIRLIPSSLNKNTLKFNIRVDELYHFLERMPGPDDCEDRKRVLAGDDGGEGPLRSAKRARRGSFSGTTQLYCKNGCGWNNTHDNWVAIRHGRLEGVVLWRPPRRCAEKELAIMDEAINEWLKDSIIKLSPPGTLHNNTLTLAAKKDLRGNKTFRRLSYLVADTRDKRPLGI
ncbi:hypothetical protein BGZ73_006103 [Actinomortierella ambigua]|nr:hypothetical protein BGZ73_006103 [Actinomortierella ambigua]